MARKRKTASMQLRRVNLMVNEVDLAWMEELATEVRDNTGGSLSRSEIVEAGIDMMREMHRIPSATPLPLAQCSPGALLRFAGVLVVHAAAKYENGKLHNEGKV